MSELGSMHHLTVTAVFPRRFQAVPTMVLMTSDVPLSRAGPTVYDAVDFFERSLFPNTPHFTQYVMQRVRLAEVLNLHNVEGIWDVPQIGGMLRKILNGGDILHPGGLPNAKIVVTRPGERVLFDGHHTVLAYMAAGKQYLDEIPHLTVHPSTGYMDESAVLVFFGHHGQRLSISNWREHVINWQAPWEEQLCPRRQNTMGELFMALTSPP